MCGIVGYIGNREAVPLLIKGIKRLEYRGYDSSGLAGISNREMYCYKTVGKVASLEEEISNLNINSNLGIVHTRWATHGAPSVDNAHPHLDCNGEIAVVHNGIIENCDDLRSILESEGHKFTSETDTEVLAHLIERAFNDGSDFESAVRKALRYVVGAYGIAVINVREPDKLIAAKKGSPVIVGVGKGEYFIASDVAAIVEYTNNVIYLDDNEMVVITNDGFSIKTIDDDVLISKEVEEVVWDIGKIEKLGYDHFMLKEIHEQPESIVNAMRGRVEDSEQNLVHFGGLESGMDTLKKVKRVVIIACGTSWHSALIGEYIFEDLLRIPVEVEYASEFRYRNPVIGDDTLVIAISQSGETADTLAGLKLAKQNGCMVLGICNVVGSSISRESDFGIFLHAGPEIGVASTKAFTSQITVIYLLALYLAQLRNHSDTLVNAVNQLRAIPDQVKEILKKEDEIIALAKLYKSSENFLYLGRGYNFPVALEGALKLKEISYIHAEGMPAAEMKHGPIALITKDMPVVFIAIKDSGYQKVLGNIKEVKARGGRIIAVATEGDESLKKHVDHIIYIPDTCGALTPILSVIPLQLLAYHIALMRGCDVDMPRNLAKSVTVE
ncbi:MAG: glutamine--fructose-6-phosphate transaminase (isomerizing) [Candidatus Anammoxibacter sp.]